MRAVTTTWPNRGDPHDEHATRPRAGSIRARDAGLTRLSRLTRAIAAAAVALAGLISGIAADARPGHVRPRHSAASGARRPVSTTSSPNPVPSASQDGADPGTG